MASEEIDYYAVLQVSPTATLQEIKTAYRQRSLKVHPDRVSQFYLFIFYLPY